MVLSNISIQKALKTGRLVISPIPSPYRPNGNEKCPFATMSVDLRLGPQIVELVPKPPHHQIFLGDGGFENIARTQSVTKIISNSHPYHLQHGAFVLGRTLEHVELPLNTKRPLAARIEGKSSFARCGLLVHFTAPTIHSGFSGTITLEMANLGPFEIILKPNMYICQLIIEEVEGIPFRNDSAFQGQTRPGGQRER